MQNQDKIADPLFEIDSKFGIDIDTEWEYELAQILYKYLFENK